MIFVTGGKYQGKVDYDEIIKYSNAYVMKSLTKIYHLSGIRLGYVISTKEKIKNIKSKQPTWSVNSVAQLLGKEYLSSVELLHNLQAYYKRETPRFRKNIIKLGFEVLDWEVHFFLIKVYNDEFLIKYFLDKGIIVRHTKNFPKLKGKYIRICTREKEQNDYLIETLREYIDEHLSN